MRRIAPVLVLLFLAPMTAELLTSSTPLRLFFVPFNLIVNLGLYGLGAILIRELARRRGLGWPRILLLGAAYGIIEEGLVIQSFFNPYHPGLGNLAVYGRLFGVNWVWAEGLTLFHAVFSITIPILLTELLFPARRRDPWLGKRGLRVVGSIFTLVVALGSLVFTNFLHQQHPDYSPPFIPYLAAIVAVGLLAGRALRPLKASARSEVLAFVPPVNHQPPRLYTLRLLGFGGIFSIYLISFTLTGKGSQVPAPVPMLLEALVAYGLYRLVRRWSGPRWLWDDRHSLALATGGLLLYALVDLLLTPFLFGAPEQGLIGLLAIVLLTLLARRINARFQPIATAVSLPAEFLTASPATMPTEYLTPSHQSGGMPASAPPIQPTIVFVDGSTQPPPVYPPDAPTINLNPHP